MANAKPPPRPRCPICGGWCVPLATGDYLIAHNTFVRRPPYLLRLVYARWWRFWGWQVWGVWKA